MKKKLRKYRALVDENHGALQINSGEEKEIFRLSDLSGIKIISNNLILEFENFKIYDKPTICFYPLTKINYLEINHDKEYMDIDVLNKQKNEEFNKKTSMIS